MYVNMEKRNENVPGITKKKKKKCRHKWWGKRDIKGRGRIMVERGKRRGRTSQVIVRSHNQSRRMALTAAGLVFILGLAKIDHLAVTDRMNGVITVKRLGGDDGIDVCIHTSC